MTHDGKRPADNDDFMEQQLAMVRGWASYLDRQRYQAHQAPDGVYIQAAPPEDVVQALRKSNADLERAQEWTRLIARYHIGPKKKTSEPITLDELVSDIATARELLQNPPSLSANDPWGPPALGRSDSARSARPRAMRTSQTTCFPSPRTPFFGLHLASLNPGSTRSKTLSLRKVPTEPLHGYSRCYFSPLPLHFAL